jgi:hypothetical protein
MCSIIEDEHIIAVIRAASEISEYEVATRSSRSRTLKNVYFRRFLEVA